MDQHETSQSKSNNDNNSKELRSDDIPKPSDNTQFKTIWKSDEDRKRLLQIINNNQLRDCPNAQKKIIDAIYDLVDHDKLDNEIYDKLHELVHNDIVHTDEYKRKHTEFVDNGRRSNSRTYQITNILKQLPTWWDMKNKTMLDVGCSEGAITAALGQELGIPAKDIHGCDVRQVSATEGFQFQVLEDPHKLPWDDGSFKIVTALMSLHHVEEPTKMLSEISRVLSDDGILLIREHNCHPPKLSMVFDLMHGFYAMVWAEPREMKDFRKHFADYHDRPYWKEKLEQAGFEELNVYQKAWVPRGNEFANPMEHYFSVFKKKGNDKLKVQTRDNRQPNDDRWNNRNQQDRNHSYNTQQYNSNRPPYSQNYQKRSYNDRDDRRPDIRHERRDDRDTRDDKRERRDFHDRRHENQDSKRAADDAGIDKSAEALEKRRKKFESQ